MESAPEDGRNLGVSHRGSVESTEEHARGPSFYERHIYATGSSCSPLDWEVYSPISSLHSYRLDSDSDHLSSVGDCSLALAGLRGCVSQSEPCYAGPFFKEVKRDEREEEDERSRSDSVINEGIIFYNEVRSLSPPLCSLDQGGFENEVLILVLSENPTSGLRVQGGEGVHSL